MIKGLHTWIRKRTKIDNECSKQVSKKKKTTFSIKAGKRKGRQRSVLYPKFSGNELSDPSKKIIVKLHMLQSELDNLKMEQEVKV